MAAITNTVTSTDMNVALDQELIMRFTNEYNRLAEILGIFAPEVMAAGTALYQLKITGTLNEQKDGDNGASSGDAYVEGDLVALSKFSASKVPVGDLTYKPYRRMTTAQAIQKAGYGVAVMRTDNKMLVAVQNKIVADFFTFLANGTGTASGVGLQDTCAQVDAKLGDTLETNNDATAGIVHFMSRQDAADYLGKAQITTQTAFGMTYMQNFLGFTNVFLTNKVAKGMIYATPIENIRIFGADFGELSQGGLVYQQDSNGLIGVAHAPVYDRVSTETNILTGMKLFAEVQDYIVKGTISPSGSTGSTGSTGTTGGTGLDEG